MKQALSYCAEQVRRYDRDRFLCTLFAPSDKRERLFALYAFNLEVAKTREVVTEPMMGQIRLQWWHNAIAALYAGAPPRHPVLEALAPWVDYMDEGLLLKILEARELDLSNAPPNSGDELKLYARATGGNLMQLAGMLLEADAKKLASALDFGESVALAGLLRAIPFHAAQHKCYLPTDLMEQMGCTLRDFFHAQDNDPITKTLLSPIVEVIAKEAQRLLSNHPKKIDRSHIGAFLSAVQAKAFLGQLKQVNYNPFAPALLRPHPLHPLALAKAWMLESL